MVSVVSSSPSWMGASLVCMCGFCRADMDGDINGDGGDGHHHQQEQKEGEGEMAAREGQK